MQSSAHIVLFPLLFTLGTNWAALPKPAPAVLSKCARAFPTHSLVVDVDDEVVDTVRVVVVMVVVVPVVVVVVVVVVAAVVVLIDVVAVVGTITLLLTRTVTKSADIGVADSMEEVIVTVKFNELKFATDSDNDTRRSTACRPSSMICVAVPTVVLPWYKTARSVTTSVSAATLAVKETRSVEAVGVKGSTLPTDIHSLRSQNKLRVYISQPVGMGALEALEEVVLVVEAMAGMAGTRQSACKIYRLYPELAATAVAKARSVSVYKTHFPLDLRAKDSHSSVERHTSAQTVSDTVP